MGTEWGQRGGWGAVGSFEEQVKENRLVNEETDGGWGPKSII